MSTRRKMLFNCEGLQSIPGINAADDAGNDIEILLSGKSFHCISNDEEGQVINKIIRENCDIIFCTEAHTEGFNFYPVPMVRFFAYDSRGNYFGTLNGFGNIEDHDFPVVFINKNSGAYGKISDNVKSFFSLANYYPYWRTIIEHEKNETSYDLQVLEIEEKADEIIYSQRQKAIEEALNLSKGVNVIEMLIENLRNEPGFFVYGSIKDAEKKNEFIVL